MLREEGRLWGLCPLPVSLSLSSLRPDNALLTRPIPHTHFFLLLCPPLSLSLSPFSLLVLINDLDLPPCPLCLSDKKQIVSHHHTVQAKSPCLEVRTWDSSPGFVTNQPGLDQLLNNNIFAGPLPAVASPTSVSRALRCSTLSREAISFTPWCRSLHD